MDPGPPKEPTEGEQAARAALADFKRKREAKFGKVPGQ